MLAKSNLILSAPPDFAKAAQETGLPVAHMAYRIGGGPHLFRANMPVAVRGGLMVIDNRGFDGRGESTPFCHEVLRECTARGFTGVFCDFEGRPMQLLAKVVEELGSLLHKRNWPLYVTEAYGNCSDKAKVLISTALSGGSLRQRLEEYRDEHPDETSPEERFGTPQQVAAGYVDDMDTTELLQALRYRRRVITAVVSGILAALVVLTAALCMQLCDYHRAIRGWGDLIITERIEGNAT